MCESHSRRPSFHVLWSLESIIASFGLFSVIVVIMKTTRKNRKWYGRARWALLLSSPPNLEDPLDLEPVVYALRDEYNDHSNHKAIQFVQIEYISTDGWSSLNSSKLMWRKRNWMLSERQRTHWWVPLNSKYNSSLRLAEKIQKKSADFLINIANKATSHSLMVLTAPLSFCKHFNRSNCVFILRWSVWRCGGN